MKKRRARLWLGRSAKIAGTVLVLALLALLSAPWAEHASSAPPPSETVLYQEDFEDGQAQDWDLDPGWTVTRDVDGQGVLRGRGNAWARYRGDAWGDYTLTLRLKLVRGRLQIDFRLGDCPRYIVSFDEGGIYLGRESPCMSHREVRTRGEEHKRNRWYELKITGTGGKLDVYVDGALKLTFTDPGPLTYGAIGLTTLDDTWFHDSESYVDDIKVLGQAPLALGLRWEKTGGPRGGIGYDIRIHPLDYNVLWVTDAWAGAHRSTDGGRSWTAMNTGITARSGPSGDGIPIFSLTIDQKHPEILWAGTQAMRGVFKSTDGGETWSEMENGIEVQNGMEIRSFSVDPTNSDVVYMGGSYTPNPSELAVRGFIYKTTDGGKHWTKLLEPGAVVRWLLIDPSNADVIYAPTGIWDRLAVKPEGILKSTDGGRTWSSINEGLTSLAVNGLVMDPRNSQVLIATMGKASGFLNEERELNGAVFKTTDGGQNWRKVYPPTDREVRYSAVAFAPSDPDIVYVDAGTEVLRSSDGGDTWQRFRMQPEDAYRDTPIALAVHPEHPELIYMNAYGGGVFRSDDGGRTWVDASVGYTGSQSWDVATHPMNPDFVLVGSKNDVHVSFDRGRTWQGRNTPWVAISMTLAVAVDPTNPDRILIGHEMYGCIRRSETGGQTWKYALPDLGEEPPSKHMSIYQIVFASSQPSTLYAASGISSMAFVVPRETQGCGVFKSTNGGKSWFPVNLGLEAADLNTFALAVHPSNPDLVYVGTLDNGVFVTTDGGATWSKSGSGMPPVDVRSLAIDSSHPDIVYAGTDGMALFKSVDGGKTWQRSSVGLNPEALVRSIVVDPVRPEYVYAADRRSGVYRSTDGGRSWVQIKEGLTTRAVNRLAISPDGKTLYAATEGGGVFRLDLTPSDGR
jgi:photosystem II stability/assembly factor-like uncharacterized protein